jgi:hypothetical protein
VNPEQEHPARQINIVMNWTDELKGQAP